MEQRIIELESKVAFQEDTILKLHDIIAEHQKQLYRLTREVAAVRDRLLSLAPSLLADQGEETPPPHY